jgi:hypothetical protein
MHPIFTKISSAFVYGPLTNEELATITVARSQVPEPDGWYVGVQMELPHLVDKKIFKWVPPVLEQPAEVVSEEPQPE